METAEDIQEFERQEIDEQTRVIEHQVCLGDVLYRPKEELFYVVRNVHQQVNEGRFQVVGYTLLELASLTDREATSQEVRQQLQRGLIAPYYPKVARRIHWHKLTSDEPFISIQTATL